MTRDRIAASATAAARWASTCATAIAAVAVLACFAVVCWGVAARYFFNRPLVWSDEVSGWLVVGIVMLAIADCQRRNENIGVDLLLEKSHGRRRAGLLAFGMAMVAICALAMTWYGVEMVQFSRMLDLRSNTIGWVPVWPVQVLVPLGAGLLLVVSVAQLIIVATGRTPDHYDAPAGESVPKAGIE
ncbi:MAG: TRAP transporter small permease [Rhodospirillales bacterium]|nr:TRAP transporter small permease [Rhodospirillales bacterium]